MTYGIKDKLSRQALADRREFGANIRLHRKRLGWSQEKLAAVAGVERQSINRAENAAFSPLLDRAYLYADALGVPLGDLLPERHRTGAARPAEQLPNRRSA